MPYEAIKAGIAAVFGKKKKKQSESAAKKIEKATKSKNAVLDDIYNMQKGK